MKTLHCAVLVLSSSIMVSCHSIDPKAYPIASGPRASGIASATAQRDWRSVRIPIRKGSPEVRLRDRLDPIWWFGNADEPEPPSWYLPGHRLRMLKWRFRNSFHNFNDYVIGVADKETVRYEKCPQSQGGYRRGWNFAVTEYRHLRLPFADYRRGRFEFYLGWRERGNFGAKLNFRQDK